MKKLFRCTVCGYVHVGSDAPEVCPKCGAPKDKFVELSNEDTEKIYSSDRTNDIHMELVTLANKIIKLSEEGININLDPPCVSTFDRTKNGAWIIKQMAKAEIEGHTKKGKW